MSADRDSKRLRIKSKAARNISRELAATLDGLTPEQSEAFRAAFLGHFAEHLDVDPETVSVMAEFVEQRKRVETLAHDLSIAEAAGLIDPPSEEDRTVFAVALRELEALSGVDRGLLTFGYDPETLDPLGYWHYPDAGGPAEWRGRAADHFDQSEAARSERRRRNEHHREITRSRTLGRLRLGTPVRPILRAVDGSGVMLDRGWLSFPEQVDEVLEAYPDAEFQTPDVLWPDDLAALDVVAEAEAIIEGTAAERSGLYVDIGALLDGDSQSPRPDLGVRSDGARLLYRGAVNVLVGDPESGKTLAASAVLAEALLDGGSVLVVDLDHNGAAATVARFRSFGVPASTLRDPRRFRLAMPEDADEVRAIVTAAAKWKPDAVLIDSVGELLPVFAADSNSADDFTRVNREVMAKLATQGAAVIGIDHLSKSAAAGVAGPTGTIAKKRAVDGVMFRVRVVRPFTPGAGGKADLTILKDRHGGVRETSPVGEKEPLAATFELKALEGGGSDWRFHAPGPARAPQKSDLDLVSELNPAPTSVRDVRRRLSWGDSRAKQAFLSWQAGRQE